MQKTQNYNLNKPELTDPVRVDDFNENAEIIDAALKTLTTAVGAAGNCKIASGSYTGTGKYGSSNKNTLTFDFEPKVVFVFSASGYGPYAETAYTGSSFGISHVVFYQGGSKFTVYQSSTATMNYTMSGNTLSWYCAQSAISQMNGSSTKYGYVAIG